MPSIIFVTDYFETSGLAQQLIAEKEEVKVCILQPEYKHIMKGIVDQIDDYHFELGKGNLFVLDGCERGELVEWLRSQGELVVGGTRASDEFENDRMKGIEIFKKYNIPYPKSKKYDNFEQAIKDIKTKPGQYVFKQMGDASKGFSYVGKHEDGSDLIDRIEHYKTLWVERIDGPINFLLQERVKGHEVAVGAYFNGNDWIRDKDGYIAVEVNFEGKKMLTGDLGSTTGETTTMMFSSNEENKLFVETLAKLEPYLKEIEYKGDVDLNCIVTEDDEIFVLEPTMRFGIPALDMQIGAQRSPWGELLRAIAEGRQPKEGLSYIAGWTCVLVLFAPPFPYETHKAENQGAGQRIYFYKGGEWQGKDYMTKQMLLDMHFHEVDKKEDGSFHLTGSSGYVMTMTANGHDHNAAAELAVRYVEDYLNFSELGYRKDAGARLNHHIQELKEMGYIEPIHGEELTGIYEGN